MGDSRKTDRISGELLEALRARLPGDWTPRPHPHWRLESRRDWGWVGVGPGMTYKHLPATSVFLEYGVAHDRLEATLRALKKAAGFDRPATYQVSQTTENRPLRRWRGSVAVRDHRRADAGGIVRRLLGRRGPDRLGELFERFGDLHEIRDSLEHRDGALLTFGAVDNIVAIDLALDDLEHLRRYRETCRPRHFRRMVDDALEALDVTL